MASLVTDSLDTAKVWGVIHELTSQRRRQRNSEEVNSSRDNTEMPDASPGEIKTWIEKRPPPVDLRPTRRPHGEAR